MLDSFHHSRETQCFSLVSSLTSLFKRRQLESRKRIQISDAAFMGLTHAMSALAVVLCLIAFAPDFTYKILRGNAIPVIVLFCLCTIGSSLLPDLDNTSSRAKSDLGPLGLILSTAFRSSSIILQTVLRTRRDDPNPNPHRGAWHTIPAALLLGFLMWIVTKTPGYVNIPSFGKIGFGVILGGLISSLLTLLTLSSIGKKVTDSIKKKMAGELIIFLACLIINFALISLSGASMTFWWLGVSVALGMTIHIIGDCFTTAGAPILFPLSAVIKGKFWWTTRFLPIKAGGPFENYVFLPAFTIISLLAGAYIAVTSF